MFFFRIGSFVRWGLLDTLPMSKILREGEAFLLFLTDPASSKKQIRLVLLNSSLTHLKVLTEIFHNLLKNQGNLYPPTLKHTVQKRKRFISKFISLFKASNQGKQRVFISKNFQLFHLIISQSKKFIFSFVPKSNYK